MLQILERMSSKSLRRVTCGVLDISGENIGERIVVVLSNLSQLNSLKNLFPNRCYYIIGKLAEKFRGSSKLIKFSLTWNKAVDSLPELEALTTVNDLV
jgi:hypothetical protein